MSSLWRAAASLATRLPLVRNVDVLEGLPAAAWAVRQLFVPRPHAPPLAPDLAAHAPPPTASPLASALPARLLDALLLMAVPKKRTSYTRKRTRQAGQIAMRGPKHKAHLNLCPVCERMRAPHRVCEREDCKTYFKHRWM